MGVPAQCRLFEQISNIYIYIFFHYTFQQPTSAYLKVDFQIVIAIYKVKRVSELTIKPFVKMLRIF